MKVITRSVVQTATKPGPYQNLRANARSPTLAPKPVTHKLRVNDRSEDVFVETVDEDEDEDDAHDVEERTNDGSNPNVNPEAAKKTHLRTAMEDVVNSGGDLPTIDITDILGRTFITSPNESGEQTRARIGDAEFTQQRTADEMEPLIKFKCRVGDKRFEQVMTYNRMLQYQEEQAWSLAEPMHLAVSGAPLPSPLLLRLSF